MEEKRKLGTGLQVWLWIIFVLNIITALGALAAVVGSAALGVGPGLHSSLRCELLAGNCTDRRNRNVTFQEQESRILYDLRSCSYWICCKSDYLRSRIWSDSDQYRSCSCRPGSLPAGYIFTCKK